jgi:hypothetical protein
LSWVSIADSDRLASSPSSAASGAPPGGGVPSSAGSRSSASASASAGSTAAFSPPGEPPSVASRSMMSRSSIFPSISASRHWTSARMVSGESHRPPIILSRPASMRLAIAISPSRLSSSIEPISRRYIRTGSSVRPIDSASMLPPLVNSLSLSSSSFSAWLGAGTGGFSPSSFSSLSTTLMPASESCASVSSICSDDTFSCGRMALISSTVT